MIRRAQPADLDRITAIAQAAYAPYVAAIGRAPAPMVADFAAHLAQDQLWVFAAPQVQGYIVLHPSAPTAHIENVAVAPDAAGQGLGKCLIGFAETHSAKAGATRMALYTNIHMTPNLTLYPHLGYTEVARRTEDGFQRVFFEKILNPELTQNHS